MRRGTDTLDMRRRTPPAPLAWWAACRIEPELLTIQARVARLTRGDLWAVLSWSDTLAELCERTPARAASTWLLRLAAGHALPSRRARCREKGGGSMTITDLLARLDAVTPEGDGQWSARSPRMMTAEAH